MSCCLGASDLGISLVRIVSRVVLAATDGHPEGRLEGRRRPLTRKGAAPASSGLTPDTPPLAFHELASSQRCCSWCCCSVARAAF